MVSITRRDFLKMVAGVAAVGVFGFGYSDVIDKVVKPAYYEVKPDRIFEGVRYTYSVCLGCNVRCGIRVRVMRKNGIEVVERIEGNPYHPYNRAVAEGIQWKRLFPISYDTPVKESLKYVGTLCARGQDGIHYLYDPYRVLKPLKRAGPRGSGKFKVISWEQLIREVVEGGVIEETGERLPGIKDIFVYGVLRDAGFDPNAILSEMKRDVDRILKEAPKLDKEGLARAIEEFKSKWNKILGEKGLSLNDILIDPDRPDLGTKANQLVFIRGRGQGHADYFSSRWVNAFGSVNWLRHTSSCQLGYYAGNVLWAGTTDINPDIVSAKVIIMAGVQMGRQHPGATGQGVLIRRAADGELKVYYVNPTAPRTTANGNIIWVPIKPGTDGALAMALIRWVIENERYNKEFLEIPNEASAKKRGYPVYTNATWLVITEKGHEREGEFLRARDIGLDGDSPVVYSNGKLVPSSEADTAELFYTGRVVIGGREVEVKTVLQLLKEQAFSRSMEEWSRECGVSVDMIIQMARDFTDAAPMAATYLHRGVGMHTNGEYAVFAYRALDILVGNYHRKGGLLGRAGHTNYNTELYNVSPTGFGEPVKWGPPIDRHKYYYEKTLEYHLKSKEGNPYPAKRPWYPLTPEESYTEAFAGMDEGYPYPIRALIMYYANPVLSANYGVKFIKVLKDTSKIPLFIAITTTINETFLYADYIVPDTTYLETGTMGVQYLYASSGGVLLAEGWRSPVVLPLTEKIGEDPNGYPRYASMWEFLIDVAKRLGMPGYGDKAIPGAKGSKYEGQWFPLHSVWDYIMRVFANAAASAVKRGYIPEKVDREEVEFVERNYIIARFKDILPPDEWEHVAYGLARGGVFASYEESFDEKGWSKRKPPRTLLMLWNEELAKTRNSITGERFYGGPKYIEEATYAPVDGRKRPGYPGTHLRELYPENEWPFIIVVPGSPLYTKHRSQFYYWIKAIMPENFILINPEDAKAYGIETGDVIEVITPTGRIQGKVVVESTVRKGVIAVPVGMGRWSDTVVKKPSYIEGFNEEEVDKAIKEIPENVEIPDDAINPVKSLDSLTKKILFTQSPPEYYNIGKVADKWRFNGITPNPAMLADPSLGNWPLLSWIGAAQVYFFTPAKIKKTGKKEKVETLYYTW